jgi:inner membrane protein
MDSLSQAALGAAVAVAVMGRRTAVWKAAALGAVAGTLPDLDVLFDQGDPILNMVLHRAETHALFWLTLFSLPFGWLVARLAGEGLLWRRWWAAMAAALLTHPLLDAVTVYGTQLALPFSNHPFGVGSLFIIDPAYTLPLLLGVLLALALGRRPAGLKLNAAGLALSTAYIGWSMAAQAHVEGVARESLAAQGLAADRLLVSPTPFNTIAWRVVAVDEAGSAYREGFYSLLDAPAPPAERIRFDRFERGNALAAEVSGIDGVARIQAFSKGLWALAESDGRLRITDLRMGQEPNYTFSFVVAERQSAPQPLSPSQHVGRRGDPGQALPWLWRRIQGEPIAPPR